MPNSDFPKRMWLELPVWNCNQIYRQNYDILWHNSKHTIEIHRNPYNICDRKSWANLWYFRIQGLSSGWIQSSPGKSTCSWKCFTNWEMTCSNWKMPHGAEDVFKTRPQKKFKRASGMIRKCISSWYSWISLFFFFLFVVLCLCHFGNSSTNRGGQIQDFKLSQDFLPPLAAAWSTELGWGAHGTSQGGWHQIPSSSQHGQISQQFPSWIRRILGHWCRLVTSLAATLPTRLRTGCLAWKN